MATAEELRAEFERYMTAKDIKFQIRNVQDNIVRIGFNTDNGEVEIFADFDENGNESESVHFATHIGDVSAENKSKGLVACNEWNRGKRWAKAYIDDDNEIWADFDARIYPGTAGEECLHSVFVLLTHAKEFRKANSAILKGSSDPDLSSLTPEQLDALLKILGATK